MLYLEGSAEKLERERDFEGPGIAIGRVLAEQVRRGLPEVSLERLAGARGLGAGAAALLLDPRHEPLGAGIADPARGVFRVWSREPVRALGAGFFREKLEKALSRRAELLEDRGTNALRLLHGDGDGLSGFAVDRWGEFVVVQVFGSGPERWSPALERALAERLNPRGIIRKLVFAAEAAGEERGPDGAPLERGKVEETVVHGERPPEELAVLERGIPFQVRLLGARHAGLFTDMREERQRLQRLAAGLRVLNTFAYTGAFSVAAALGGAREVVSVDVVAKVLDWARENFRLSGIDPGAHRFVCMDTGEYLELAARKGWTFGAIVLDPPTFARSKSGNWSLERDYPALIRRALGVLEPGGYLWVSANSASVREAEVDRWIRTASSAAGRPLTLIARGGQPPDYPAPPEFPRYRYLKVRVLRAGRAGGALDSRHTECEHAAFVIVVTGMGGKYAE